MSEKVLPIPCTKVEETTINDWFQKINQELDIFKEMIYRFYPGIDWVCELKGQLQDFEIEDMSEKATDIITTITSMLEAMGIDENMRQAVQKRVNEKNKELGRF